jgi:hypothetical protein
MLAAIGVANHDQERGSRIGGMVTLTIRSS